MWELYSMWGWIAVIFASANGWSKQQYESAAAVAIGIGAIGCVWAGAASDRFQNQAESIRVGQRARVTIVAMAVSAACCLVGALVYRQPALLAAVSLIWGIAVIADSAQFSTIISEVSDKSYQGTALTVQTAIGFLLTAFSLRCMAALAARWGWKQTLASMAIGPVLGIWAMSRLLAGRGRVSTD
jgi:MFS family permease